MAVKKCSKCGSSKPFSAFSTNGSGYLKARCKSCRSSDVCAAYAKKTPEQKRSVMARISAWVKANPDKYRGYAARTRAANPDHYRLKVQLRRRRHRKATVSWADKKAIAAIYRKAALLTKQSGIPHEVDHIVPLVSAFVCGFHCESNLRVISMLENKRKNNLTWPGKEWSV